MRKTVAIITALALILMFTGCGQLKEVLIAQMDETGEADTDSEESSTDNGEIDTDSEEAYADSEDMYTDYEEEELVEVTLGEYSGYYSFTDGFEQCSLDVTVIDGTADIHFSCRKGQENWASGVISGGSFSAGITCYDHYNTTGDTADLLSGKIDITFNGESASVTVKWEDDDEANTYEMTRDSDDAGKTIKIPKEIYE